MIYINFVTGSGPTPGSLINRKISPSTEHSSARAGLILRLTFTYAYIEGKNEALTLIESSVGWRRCGMVDVKRRGLDGM